MNRTDLLRDALSDLVNTGIMLRDNVVEYASAREVTVPISLWHQFTDQVREAVQSLESDLDLLTREQLRDELQDPSPHLMYGDGTASRED